jgi:DNA polymerase-3 subunit delta
MTQHNIIILHGEDSTASDGLVATLLKDLGDPSMAEMNTARLDGRTASLEMIVQAVSAMPFLAARRFVILTNPLERTKTPQQQIKFLEILGRVPPTTTLVIMLDHLLGSDRGKKKNEPHWLERWAKQAGSNVMLQAFPMPESPRLGEWVTARVKAKGGQITSGAAMRLAALIGPSAPILMSEIEKLLAYVNYTRTIEEEDVLHLTPSIPRLEDFALINALRARNAQQALKVLRLEIEEKDEIIVFQNIVYQFRNLLLARELASEGNNEQEIAARLKLHPYAARLALEHARRFTLGELETIYHTLLEVDVAMKTGGMPADLALDVLVTSLTQ